MTSFNKSIIVLKQPFNFVNNFSTLFRIKPRCILLYRIVESCVDVPVIFIIINVMNYWFIQENKIKERSRVVCDMNIRYQV